MLLLALSVVQGCAGTLGEGGESTSSVVPRPSARELAGQNYPLLRRAFERLPPDAPQREATRALILAHLRARASKVTAARDYDLAREVLSRWSSLFGPDELTEAFDLSIRPLALFLKEAGELRGDEATVLSALWVLSRIESAQPSHLEEYRFLLRWSDESRGAPRRGVLGGHPALLAVYEEHARLIPALEVMRRLEGVYRRGREGLVEMFGGMDSGAAMRGAFARPMAMQAAQLRAIALRVAALYLVRGDVELAREAVERPERLHRVEQQLVEHLSTASERHTDLLPLAEAYVDFGRVDVARALCLRGALNQPDDPAFPLCLAHLARQRELYSESVYEFSEAIRLAPDDRGYYDEALRVLGRLVQSGQYGLDPTRSRELTAQAISILQQRTERWPGVPPPIEQTELTFALAVAEMNAGNASEAKELLQASLRAGDDPRIWAELGRLQARTGEPRAAVESLQRALSAGADPSIAQLRLRALRTEYLGDAWRALDKQGKASASYERAQLYWEQLLAHPLEGALRGAALVRRGVLLDRQGKHARARASFEKAMRDMPDQREVYTQVLAHMVSVSPDPAFAREVFRRARRQMSLEADWKAYYLMWIKCICELAGAQLEVEEVRMLKMLGNQDAWWSKLARFALGELDHTRLRELALSRDQHSEADFYEGVRLLGLGQWAAGIALLRGVTEQGMVSLYEFQMATELLHAHPAPPGDVLQAAEAP